MQSQNTAPKGAPQAFDQEVPRRKYEWLGAVKRDLRSDQGREVCKQRSVCPRLVADLADEISGYPSFKDHGEVWAGQQRLGLRLGVQDRQVRRAVGALVGLDLLRIEREHGRRGKTNKMVALLNGRSLFEPRAAGHGSSASGRNRTGMSSENRTQASSNLIGEEAKKYTSPVGPSETATSVPPAAQEEDSEIDDLKSEGTSSQAEPDRRTGNARGHEPGGKGGFARLMSVYPHPTRRT
jgi:hypothetical protein